MVYILEKSNHPDRVKMFGLVLLNDWSARDIQAWEYQPLGPFLAKNFLTTISPWVISPEALAPFRSAMPPRPAGDPDPLPYLRDPADTANGALGVSLSASLLTAKMRAAGDKAHVLSEGEAAAAMYWSAAQIVTHHSSNGCNLMPGDLIGTGTLSVAESTGLGSLLEISQGGKAPLDLWQLVQQLMAAAPKDTIITNGAGNYATWAHRFYRYGAMRTQLAPTSGAMGYGVPAGVAAKIIDPQRTVVTFAGDGEYMMNGQELATAVQYKAGVVIIIFNNSMFGTIRMHQERDYPERISATALANPDFAKLAEAYGGWAMRVEATADFAAALDQAMERTGIRLIHCITDVEIISNQTTIAALRGR